MRIRWKGKLFSDDPILFVFGTQCEGICLVKADVIKALATNHQTRLALNTLKPMGVGLIANLALDAVSAIRHPTKGNAGFIVGYKNADNETGLFFAIASSEIVDEIVASIPPEKVTPDNA